MDDAAAVHVGESGHELPAEGPGSTLREPALPLGLHQRAQVTAGRVLHHQTVQVTRLTDIHRQTHSQVNRGGGRTPSPDSTGDPTDGYTQTDPQSDEQRGGGTYSITRQYR